MLSPEEIQKIRSEAGMPPLTTGTGAAASSLSDRLGLNVPIKEVTPEEPSLGKKLLNRAKYATTESINRISDSYNDPNASALDTAGTAARELTGGAIMHTIGAAGGAVGDVIGSALDTASNILPTNSEQSGSFKKSANPFNKNKDVVANPSTEEAPNNNDLLSKAYSKWQEFSANNPNQAKDLEDIGNAFNLLGIESLGKTAAGSALKTSAKDALKKTGVDVLVGDTAGVVKKAVNTNKIDDIVSKINPTEDIMTPTQKKLAIDTGRQVTKSGITGKKVEYLADNEVKRAANLLSDTVKSKDTPNIVYKKVKDKIKVLGVDAENYLNVNGKNITATMHRDAVNNMKLEASNRMSKAALKAYNDELELFGKQLPSPKNGEISSKDYYLALKKWEANVADSIPKGKEAIIDPTGIGSARINAAADIRKMARDLIGDVNPEFKERMHDLSSLYTAKDNALHIASKEKSQNIFEKYPKTTKAVAGAAALAGTGSIVNNAMGIAK